MNDPLFATEEHVFMYCIRSLYSREIDFLKRKIGLFELEFIYLICLFRPRSNFIHFSNEIR